MLISVVFAHRREIQTLKGLVRSSDLSSIVSWRRWARRQDLLLAPGQTLPDLIINAGFAGRINIGLSLGQVVLVSDITIDEASSKLPLSGSRKIRKFTGDRGVDSVLLVTSKAPITSVSARQALRSQTGADIVDMEGGHLCNLADESGIPFISFKVISDDADHRSWDTIKRNNDRWAGRLAAVVFDFIDFYVDENNCNHTGI